MTASEIKTAIENGTKEFVSVSKQSKYTVKKLPIIKWWRADITDIHSGNHKGVCVGNTLETFCEDLSKTRDLEPFTELDLTASVKTEDLAEMDYSITPRSRISQRRLQKQIITGFSFCIPESKQSTRIELLKSVANLR